MVSFEKSDLRIESCWEEAGGGGRGSSPAKRLSDSPGEDGAKGNVVSPGAHGGHDPGRGTCVNSNLLLNFQPGVLCADSTSNPERGQMIE